VSLGWVEAQSAGLHPVVDVGDARTQTGDDGGGVVGWSGDNHELGCHRRTCTAGIDAEQQYGTVRQCT